jgi:hypothetical protein
LSIQKSKNIIIAGLKGYETKLADSKREGGRKLHQSAWESEDSRQLKKLTGKTDWFRGKRHLSLLVELDMRKETTGEAKEGRRSHWEGVKIQKSWRNVGQFLSCLWSKPRVGCWQPG